MPGGGQGVSFSKKWRVISSSLLLQALSFLSLLPSEAGGGIRGMALPLRAQGGSPSACRFQHPEDPAPVFSRSLSST